MRGKITADRRIVEQRLLSAVSEHVGQHSRAVGDG
jgi:hypothetical protein